MMIPTPPAAPVVAQSEAPVAVPTNSTVSMEVEHTVPPSAPQLDIKSAAAMIANTEKISEMEIEAELDEFYMASI